MRLIKHTLVSLMLAAIILLTIGTAAADDLISDSRRSLQQLVVQNPAATRCRSKAVAVLVFPEVVKAASSLALKKAKESFRARPTQRPLPDRSRLLWLASRRSEIRNRWIHGFFLPFFSPAELIL
jgi:hypothetical protein